MAEGRSLAGRIGLGQAQVRADGTRIGETHTGADGAEGCLLVGSGDPLCALDRDNRGERQPFVGRIIRLPIEPIGRERRESESENAHHAMLPCPTQAGRSCAEGTSGTRDSGTVPR